MSDETVVDVGIDAAVGPMIAMSAAAAAVKAQEAENKVQELVNKWLATSDTEFGGWYHITAMLTAQLATMLTVSLAYPKTSTNQKISSALSYASLPALSEKATQYMNQAFDLFRQPNIEGITIFASKEQFSGDTDISYSPLVVQQDQASTTYVCDNAVPRPREWNISGYLMSVSSLDNGLVTKPSIVLQHSYLDYCRMSRRPVWYKTHEGKFYRVLIAHLDTSYDPKALNGSAINIRLVEYIPLKVNTLHGPVKDAVQSLAGL